MTRYTVTAQRGSDPTMWVFQCQEVPGAISQSRRLSDAATLIPEAIAFVAGLDDTSDIEVDLIPVLPAPLDDEVHRARQAVKELARQQREAAALSRQTVRHLQDAGLTGADTATVLGLSPQRVSQLRSRA